MVFQELSLTIIYRSLVLALDQEIVRRFRNPFQDLIFKSSLSGIDIEINGTRYQIL